MVYVTKLFRLRRNSGAYQRHTKHQADTISVLSNVIYIKIQNLKNLKQIEVATQIGVDTVAYIKVEKDLRALDVDKLQKMTQL